MAADEARAQRIRELKQEHPELTWQAIADHVGVTLRAAQAWQETGGIAYDNAKRLAELAGVDVEWIMRGPRGQAPDVLRGLQNGEQLDRMEAILEELLKRTRNLPPAERAPGEDEDLEDVFPDEPDGAPDDEAPGSQERRSA